MNYYSFVDNKNMLQHILWILKLYAVFTLLRKWNISPRKVLIKLVINLSIKDENNVVIR